MWDGGDMVGIVNERCGSANEGSWISCETVESTNTEDIVYCGDNCIEPGINSIVSDAGSAGGIISSFGCSWVVCSTPE